MSDQSNAVSSSVDELATRIKAVADLYESRKSAASAAGISTDMLTRYMRGESQPGFMVIANLSAPVGVSLLWVGYGKGPMMVADLDFAAKLENQSLYSPEFAEIERQCDEELPEEQAELNQSPSEDRALSESDRELLKILADRTKDEALFKRLADRFALDAEAQELKAEFALVPGYSVQVAAGAGALPDSEQPSRKLAFRRRWLRFRGLNEKDLVLVFAKGDSMEPTISDNNTVMIDTSQREMIDGSIYVIRTDHHLIVKRVQTLLGSSILLISDNKAYQPIEVKMSEATDLEVIGRVVWIGKDL